MTRSTTSRPYLFLAARALAAAAVVATALAAPPALAAGFDCRKAVSSAEHTICENPRLSDYDSRMSTLYGGLVGSIPEKDRQALKKSQKEFLKRRNACRASVPCIDSSYWTRMQELCTVAKQNGRSCADTGEQPR